MKYALIGCGRIAVNHIRAAVKNGLEIAAVCDTNPKAIDILFEKTGYTGTPAKFTNHLAMLEAMPDIKLIAIATESGSHAKIALDCIERGVNILIEKPMAMSMADADRIIAAAKEKGSKVTVCHQNRFNRAVQNLRGAVETGRFGRLSHGSVCVRWNRNKAYYDQASWRGKWASDGGTLMNQCIHGIDLLRWMMGGEAVEVYGMTARRFHDYLEAEDLGTALIRFADGSVGTVEGTVNVYPKNLEETLHLFGETGTVKLGGTSCNSVDVWQFADEKDARGENVLLTEETSNVYGNGHALLYADMIDAVTRNREPYITAKDGRDALEIVLAIYKSRLTGLPVALPLTDFSSEDMIGIFDHRKS